MGRRKISISKAAAEYVKEVIEFDLEDSELNEAERRTAEGVLRRLNGLIDTWEKK